MQAQHQDSPVIIIVTREKDNTTYEDKFPLHTKLSEVRKCFDWMTPNHKFARRNKDDMGWRVIQREDVYDIDDFESNNYNILVVESTSPPQVETPKVNLENMDMSPQNIVSTLGAKTQSIFDLNKDQMKDLLIRNDFNITLHISEDGKPTKVVNKLFDQVDISLARPQGSQSSQLMAHEICSDAAFEIMKSGIDDVKLSAGLKYLHFGAELKAHLKHSNSILNSTKTSQKKIYAEMCYPRGTLVLEDCFKSVSKEAREFFNGGVTPERIAEFFKVFGHFVPQKLEVGGKRWFVTEANAEDSLESSNKTSDLELLAKVNVHLLEMGAKYDKSKEESSKDTTSAFEKNINICAIGGDEVHCTDTEKWKDSLENYTLWKTIKILDLKPTFEYLDEPIKKQIREILDSGQFEIMEDTIAKQRKANILRDKLRKACENVEGKISKSNIFLAVLRVLQEDPELRMKICYNYRFNGMFSPLKFLDKVGSNAVGFDEYQKNLENDMHTVIDRITNAGFKRRAILFTGARADKFVQGEHFLVNDVTRPPCIELHRHMVIGHKILMEALMIARGHVTKYGIGFDKVIFELV